MLTAATPVDNGDGLVWKCTNGLNPPGHSTALTAENTVHLYTLDTLHVGNYLLVAHANCYLLFFNTT